VKDCAIAALIRSSSVAEYPVTGFSNINGRVTELYVTIMLVGLSVEMMRSIEGAFDGSIVGVDVVTGG